MINVKSAGTFAGAGILSAFAASLCCMTPVIALLASSSGVAASFAWIEPVRPYLIGLSLSALALAWYTRLKPVKTKPIDCNCEPINKNSFFQTKSFLGIVTAVTVLLITYPLHPKTFNPKQKMEEVGVAASGNKQQVTFTINGMTCKGCEDHINDALSKVKGVLAHTTSYASASSAVTFDKTKVDIKTIEVAINKTDYTVKNFRVGNTSK